MKITKRQLRRIIEQVMVGGAPAKTTTELHKLAKKEGMRWYQGGAIGKYSDDARVTTVRTSPNEQRFRDAGDIFDDQSIFRVTINARSGNRQIDVILDNERGSFQGASWGDEY